MPSPTVIFSPTDYSSETLSELAKIIYDCYENDEPIEPAIIISKFDGKKADFVSNIFCNLEEYENEKNTVAQLVKKIKIDRINRSIEEAKKNNDVMKLKELLASRLSLEGEK